MYSSTVLSLAVTLNVVVADIYIDSSYPYDQGPFDVTIFTYSPKLMPLNPPPMRTKGERSYL